MRMPEFLLFGIELVEDAFGDHIFDADQPGGWKWRVVEKALSDLIVDMGAVVVGF